MRNLGIIKSLLFRIKNLFAKHIDSEKEYLKKRIVLLERLMDEKSDSVERAKSIFLKNLYHEIRTPLNAILGFSDLIEMNSVSNKDKTTYISQIRESSREFLRKMDNIIEASIIEAGLLKLTVDECCIYDLCCEVYNYYSLQKHIAEKELVFLINVPEELRNLNVTCDTYRLTQVLSNLVSNAFKFSNRGSIELGYRIVGEEIEFFVSDSGIGGLEGKENLMYRNFSKLDDSEDSLEGLGLGLSLSKKLVELMNGKIWYKSVNGRGTTFFFTIPYRPVVPRIHKLSSEQNKHYLKRSFRRSAVL